MTTQEILHRFGIHTNQIQHILQHTLQYGAHFAELYFQEQQHNDISLDDHTVNRALTGIDLGVGIRAIVGTQVGYAYSESLAMPDMLEAARVAARIAQAAARNLQPVEIQATTHAFYSPVADQSTTPQLVELLQRLNQQIFDTDSRVQKAQFSIQTSHSYILIANSDGLLVADSQPMLRLAGSVVVHENGRREQNSHNVSARATMHWLNTEKLNDFIQELISKALEMLKAIQPKGGEMEVVLGAGGSGILLHEAIGHGLEADFNRKGLSIFSEKLGQRIASPEVSIIDDGTLHNFRGSIHIDDEGTPGQQTTLVDKGILVSYMHDRISAQHYGVPPTGNGRRQSFRHLPLPRMRNTYMLNGPHAPSDIIASVRQGIYADSFQNGQVNIGPGDFTFYVKRGFLIENGKLGAVIKDVNIIGNGPKVLEQIRMVGNDGQNSEGGWTCGKSGQSVPVSIGMPTVAAGTLTVGGNS